MSIRWKSSLRTSIALVCLLGLLVSGCTQVRSLDQLFSAQPSDKVQVELDLQVTPASNAGTYTVTGRTSLPEQTQMRVLAVRYLRPSAQSPNTDSTFSILDSQISAVSQGQWQTSLNLWRVAADGRYQEAWQMREATWLKQPLQPDESVVFLATPILDGQTDGVQQLEKLLAQRGRQLVGSQVRILPNGQRYIQTSRAIAVALPEGKTTPPTERTEAMSKGWGERTVVSVKPKSSLKVELPKEPRTTAPIAAAEFMR